MLALISNNISLVITENTGMLILVLLLPFSEKRVQYCSNIDSVGLIVLPSVIHITESSARLDAELYQWPWKCKCSCSDASFQLRSEHHLLHPVIGKPCLFLTFLDECL